VSTRVTGIRVSRVRSARLTSSRSARRSGAAAPRVKFMRARLEVEQAEVAILTEDHGPQIVVLSSEPRPVIIL
jgi:hypothetical protein